MLKTPFFNPNSDDYKFEYRDEEGRLKIKLVTYPTMLLRDPEGNKWWIGETRADKKVWYRSVFKPWLDSELDHPYNKIN